MNLVYYINILLIFIILILICSIFKKKCNKSISNLIESFSTSTKQSNTGKNDWKQLGSDIDGEAAGDKSGIFVSLSSDGKKVAIGASHNDGTDTDSGHVRIYEYTNTVVKNNDKLEIVHFIGGG